MNPPPTVQAHASGPEVALGSSEATTLGQMVLDAAARFGGVALQFPRGDQTAQISYPELGAICAEIARGLIALGIEPGDRVAILGRHAARVDARRLRRAVRRRRRGADLPHELAGGVRVRPRPLRARASSSARTPRSWPRSSRCATGCPALEHVVVLDGAATGAITLDELRAGAARPGRARSDGAPRGGRVRTTSRRSSTRRARPGRRRAACSRHANCMATDARCTSERARPRRRPPSIFLFLPLAHVARAHDPDGRARRRRHARVLGGDPQAARSRTSPTTRPTHFPSVPRVFEKIHTRALGGGRRRPARRQARHLRAGRCAAGAQARAAPSAARHARAARCDRRHALADRLVLSKVRGAVRRPTSSSALTGAAPIGREVLEFFDACGVLVLEGYGMTETCAAGDAQHRRRGCASAPSAGRCPGTEVAIADDGEILMRGPHVFDGYHRDDGRDRARR